MEWSTKGYQIYPSSEHIQCVHHSLFWANSISLSQSVVHTSKGQEEFMQMKAPLMHSTGPRIIKPIFISALFLTDSLLDPTLLLTFKDDHHMFVTHCLLYNYFTSLTFCRWSRSNTRCQYLNISVLVWKKMFRQSCPCVGPAAGISFSCVKYLSLCGGEQTGCTVCSVNSKWPVLYFNLLCSVSLQQQAITLRFK